MKYLSLIIIISLFACEFKVEIKNKYAAYFDIKTQKVFMEALNYLEQEDYRKADSLLTVVIQKGKNLSREMPKDVNPFYFRGITGSELNKYEQSLSDWNMVASDSTTDTVILLYRAYAFHMVKQYDTSIGTYNRLLSLKEDSGTVLYLRGLCFCEKGDTINACNDFKLSELIAPEIDSFRKPHKFCN